VRAGDAGADALAHRAHGVQRLAEAGAAVDHQRNVDRRRHVARHAQLLVHGEQRLGGAARGAGDEAAGVHAVEAEALQQAAAERIVGDRHVDELLPLQQTAQRGGFLHAYILGMNDGVRRDRASAPAMRRCARASREGAGRGKVLVLEKAPLEERGGNSLFTAGGFRFVHDGSRTCARRPGRPVRGRGEPDRAAVRRAGELPDDLRRVTEGQTDDTLAELLVGRSRETMSWMRRNSVRFIPMFGRQSFKLDGKHHFYGGVNIEAVGGGYGLVDQLVRQAERLGIEIRYATGLRELLQDARAPSPACASWGPTATRTSTAGTWCSPAAASRPTRDARALLRPGLGICRVRGTRYNTGDGLRAALEIDAQAFGGWSTCHAVQWDISAPPFGDRVVLDNFQKHSYPIGIIVNLDGERFVDEGADYRNHTYAKYGREVMKQPKRTAVQIFDARTIGMVRDEYRIKQVTKAEAPTLEALAREARHRRRRPRAHRARVQRRLPARASTTPRSSTACRPRASRRRSRTGRCRSTSRPTTGFVVTCGITFSFGGLRINGNCEVQDTSDRTIPGLYAAGRDRGRHLLRELPRRRRPHVGRGVRPHRRRERRAALAIPA
jgi:tricarballylate dehydrogenase